MLTYNNIEIFNNNIVNLDKNVNPNIKKFLIIDRNVYNLHKDNIIGSNIDYYIFDADEQNKSMETATSIYHNLLINNYGREDYVISIGGGITTDLGGFVASTYKRGINLIIVPTTLLSQVDSSVGSKNSLNFEGFKNVIGTFYDPKKILINTYFLTTLSEKDYYEAFSEIIKYYLIYDFKFREQLEINKYNIEELVLECVRIKSEIVKEDKFDKGIRHILNYGHSLAHLIENKYGYSHGYSVAQGMYMTSVIFENDEVRDIILKLCETYNIFLTADIKLDLSNLTTDKKTNNNLIKEVVVKKVGKPEIYEIEIDEYKKRYYDRWENYNIKR